MALENSFADPTIFFFNSGSTFFYHFPSSKWIFFSRFFILSNYLTFFFNVLYFPPIRLFRQGNIQNNLRKQSAKLSWDTISNRSVLLVWWLLIFWALFNRSLRLFRSSGSESIGNECWPSSGNGSESWRSRGSGSGNEWPLRCGSGSSRYQHSVPFIQHLTACISSNFVFLSYENQVPVPGLQIHVQ